MWCRTPKFSNIYRKTAMLESLFYKVAGLKAYIFIKKRLQHRCFAVNIAKFLRTPILKNVCKRLLLILNWWSRHQNRNQNLDRLFTMCVKTVQFSLGDSFFSKTRYTAYALLFPYSFTMILSYQHCYHLMSWAETFSVRKNIYQKMCRKLRF